MYRFVRFLRTLFIIALLAGVIGGVVYFIFTNSQKDQTVLYNRAVTAAVETAVKNALYGATRTAEAPLDQYRLITLGNEDQDLNELARQYHTSLAAIQMANGLLEDVTSGRNSRVIVPEGIQTLDPPRRLTIYTATEGDTLLDLALANDVPLEILEMDNPVLANRTLLPGDIVFIAALL